ncbi:MAG: RNA polymerase subunit sigma-70 [Robiginitomaculum sp.]|nr:MAG: RNA polymerase subunit sigma-70 [Robiginitomaculum sp.]
MGRRLPRIYDEYLVVSARAGDRAAFTRLAESWQKRLLAHAYRLTGDAELSRDVVQDGWADIVRGLANLKEPSVFPAWAYRIVTRRAADAIGRAQRKRRTEAAYAQEPDKPDMSAVRMETGADASPLHKAIAALPTKQRAAIALFYLEEFSVTEISVALSVPVGTVKTRLMHARKNLRATLEGDNNG